MPLEDELDEMKRGAFQLLLQRRRHRCAEVTFLVTLSNLS
jgi:hypothetical protein